MKKVFALAACAALAIGMAAVSYSPTLGSKSASQGNFIPIAFAAAPSCTLTASPNSITKGGSSTLTWTTQDASSISINNGIGSFTAPNGSVGVSPAVTTTYTGTVATPGTDPLYRLFKEGTPSHFYTMSAAERDAVIADGYIYEQDAGYMYTSNQPGTDPLYRLFRPSFGHFYTMSASERDSLVSSGYTYEEIAGYMYTNSQPGTDPLYRLFKPGYGHLYTMSAAERDAVIADGYIYEGITGYMYTSNQPAATEQCSATITVWPANSLPLGYHERNQGDVAGNIYECAVGGWAWDPDGGNPLTIHFYADAPAGSGNPAIGSTIAGTGRTDVCLVHPASCGELVGFSYSLPPSFYTGITHTIYAYAINQPVGGVNPLLPFLGNPPGIPGTITCSVPVVKIAGSCPLPWVGSINVGQSVTAYQNSTVPNGSNCQNETRSCVGANDLTGSYTYQNCSVTGGGSATGDARVILQVQSDGGGSLGYAVGDSKVDSPNHKVGPGYTSLIGVYDSTLWVEWWGDKVDSCTITIPGYNTWTGTFGGGNRSNSITSSTAVTANCKNSENGDTASWTIAVNITPPPPPLSSCTGPAWDGAAVPGNTNVTGYNTKTVPSGSCSSVSGTRFCDGNTGILGPSTAYQYASCSVLPAAPITCTFPWGGSMAIGYKFTAYDVKKPPSGETCTSNNHSQLRECLSSGALSGDAKYDEEKCTNPMKFNIF